MVSLLLFVIATYPILTTEQACDNIKYYEAQYDYRLDRYFDRGVAIVLNNGHVLAPGLFIDYHLIISSFNPFRNIKRQKYSINVMKICVFRGRTSAWRKINGTRVKVYVMKATTHTIKCARQIIPMPERFLAEIQWHGMDKRNSPLHDMMVFRILPRTVTKRKGRWHPFLYFPVVAHVAEPHEKIGSEVMFASFGFASRNHSINYDTLLSRQYSDHEDVVIDCDYLFPKTWGYFICLKNIDRFVGVGSGALLVYKDGLFGIGSFRLSKGNTSYLVFTDIRPYHHMLGAPCSQWEVSFGNPDSYLSRYYVSGQWDRVYYLHPEADYDVQMPRGPPPKDGSDMKHTGRKRRGIRRYRKPKIDL